LKKVVLAHHARRLRSRFPKAERWFWSAYLKAGSALVSDLCNEAFLYVIPDLTNHVYKYVVEIDEPHHEQAWVKSYDERRDKIFLEYGYRVFRIPAYDERALENFLTEIVQYRANTVPRARGMNLRTDDTQPPDIEDLKGWQRFARGKKGNVSIYRTIRAPRTSTKRRRPRTVIPKLAYNPGQAVTVLGQPGSWQIIEGYAAAQKYLVQSGSQKLLAPDFKICPITDAERRTSGSKG